MPRPRQSSSDSSSDDSSEETNRKKGRGRKKQASHGHKRRQRNASSDSSPEAKTVKSKAHGSHRDRKSPADKKDKRRANSDDSDSSPDKGRKVDRGRRDRSIDRGRREGSMERKSANRKTMDDTEKKNEQKSRKTEREHRRHSSDRERSSSRHKDRSQEWRDESPVKKQERSTDRKESDESGSPTKPILASRANYMKSLNPDRSKQFQKKPSPSRRGIESLADDYKPHKRRGIQSLADDYRQDRDRDRDGRSDGRKRDNDQRRSPPRRSPRRDSPKKDRSPKRRSVDRQRSPVRHSKDKSPRRRKSPSRKSIERQRSPVDRSYEQNRDDRSPELQRKPGRSLDKHQLNDDSSPEFHKSPAKKTHKKHKQQGRSPDVHRSPSRDSLDHRRKQDRSPEMQQSPVRSTEKQRKQDRSPELSRSPTKKVHSKKKSYDRSPEFQRSHEPRRGQDRSPEIQRSLVRGSRERRAISPKLATSPVKRSYDKPRHEDRPELLQRSPRGRSFDRKKSSTGRSLERSPNNDYLDRQRSFDSRSYEQERSPDQLSPVKKDTFRRHPPERMQRRQSLETRSPPRMLEEARLPGRALGRRGSEDRFSARPVSRRRSEERFPRRVSTSGPYDDLPPLNRSSELSLLEPLGRRRSAERNFGGRKSLERSFDQRYPLLSPPRLQEPRVRARSLERVSMRPEDDRYIRDSQPMQSRMFNRFRRDSDRGLYDEIPEPLDSRQPPLETRYRDQPEYLDRYRDDLDLVPRSVYVDRDINVRVRNDRAMDADMLGGWVDQKRNRTYSMEEDFPVRRSRRDDGSFEGGRGVDWGGRRNSESLDFIQADDGRNIGYPKRMRSNSGQGRDSRSPKRNRIGEGNQRSENSRSVSPILPDLARIKEARRLRWLEKQGLATTSELLSPNTLVSERLKEAMNTSSDNRNIRQRSSSNDRNTSQMSGFENRATKRKPRSDSEESPARNSKVSSTVTMIINKDKRSRSPDLKSPGSKAGSSTSEHKIKSKKKHTETQQRSDNEETDPLPPEKDGNAHSRKKVAKSPSKSTRDQRDTYKQENDNRADSKKKHSQSPDRSSKDKSEKDKSIKDRKRSRQVSRSPEPERNHSNKRSRSRPDSRSPESERNRSNKRSRSRPDSRSPEPEVNSSNKRSRPDSRTPEPGKSSSNKRSKSRPDSRTRDLEENSSNKRSQSRPNSRTRETEEKNSNKKSRSLQQSPTEKTDTHPLRREKIGSANSEQEPETHQNQELDRMDSFTSEPDYTRSPERQRFYSTNSEQDQTRSDLDTSRNSDEPLKRKHDMEKYTSEPESGELTDSEEEIEKRNALIKSLVNKPTVQELNPEEAERQKIEDERYLAEKRQNALDRMEAGEETVTSHVVKVSESRIDGGGRNAASMEREWEERMERRERDNKRKRQNEDAQSRAKETSQPEVEPAPKKPKADPTGVEALTMRTGGAYIPPARLRAMQASITDKSSVAYQRMSWEALKKSINGLINKVNVSNIEFIVRELFQENIVRGRGLMARSIIQAQAASPTFTHVYAALVAIVNTKFPQNGELVLRRLVIQFRRGFKRNDKNVCLSTTRFVAHLVNQQVAHEVLALEILTLLLEAPTDDSVEIVVGFLKECGQKLTDVTPRGINAIFERLRNVLHEGDIDTRVQYMVEVMFAVRKDGFKDHPSVLEDLDLVEEEDQFTHLLTLEDAGDPENLLNVFKADPNFLENEEKYKILKKEILDEGSSDEEGGSASGSDSEDSEENEEEAANKETIIDQTETNLVTLRRTIYLTIQSSLDFEECAHKLMKMELKPGQESELCYMVLDCCAQMRTYEKFFGLLAQRFCMIDKKYIEPFQIMFKEQYDTIHRLETNKLRNVAKFFAHLLHTDAISWGVLSCIKLNEDDTSSASRIFIKILIQELSEYLGLPNLNERLKDPTLQEYFEGLLPRDNPRNTRFAINFFTTIGLGGLTDDLREHLKTVSKKLMEQKQQEQEAAESSSSSDSESSAAESSSDSESSDSSEDDRRKKKKKNKEKTKQKEKSKKDKKKKEGKKDGKKAVSNRDVEKPSKKSQKSKPNNVEDESVQSRAERLRRLAQYDAPDEPLIVGSRGDRGGKERDMDRDTGRGHKKGLDRGMRNLGISRGDDFDRARGANSNRGREFRDRGDRNVERNISDNERYRDSRPGDYRNLERQMSYDDREDDRRPRIDRNFEKSDRITNRYEDIDGARSRDSYDFGEDYNRGRKNQFRNDGARDDRHQKYDSNFSARNNRGRSQNERGNRHEERNGRNRSEERQSRTGRDDRRRRR